MPIIIDESLKSELIKKLEELGLSAKESLVYIALLPLGQVGSSKVIQSTGLHGQFVYQALAKLEERGLVQHVIQSGRKKFFANPPNRILSLVHEKTRIAESLVSKLEALSGLQAYQFEVFQGDEAYVEHEFSELRRVASGAELGLIGGGEGPEGRRSQGDQFLTAMGSRMSEYEHLREEKNIRIRYIGGENQRMNLFWYKHNRKLFDYRLLPGSLSGLVNTDLWPDTINFNMFSSQIVAFSIKNEELARSYWDFFETLWRLARV